jgi:hypothetical protein
MEHLFVLKYIISFCIWEVLQKFNKLKNEIMSKFDEKVALYKKFMDDSDL